MSFVCVIQSFFPNLQWACIEYFGCQHYSQTIGVLSIYIKLEKFHCFFLFSISSLIKSWILKTINTLNIEINIIKCLHHNSNYIYWKFDRPFYKTLTWTRRCQCGEVIWIQLWICIIHNTILIIIIAKPCIIVVVNVVVFLLVKFEIIRM